MKIGIATDSFKGSLTALEAATCIEIGLKRVLHPLTVIKVPMADGGEGTVQAIIEATGGRWVTRSVHDPLGRKIKTRFGITGDGKTATLEMASASGLVLLDPAERNPMITSTFGTGEMIKHALNMGVRKILIGIGGSATNDGGTGMARALGVRFLDASGKKLPEGGGSLLKLAKIDLTGLDPRLKKVSVEVACDVDNPLTGPRGASTVYGPQKGATPAMVRELDACLKQFATIVRKETGIRILTVPGSGAAGGLGAGLMAFLTGQLRPGVDIVIDSVGLKKKLKGCDLVITGEGRMDGQTVFGKTPAGVARVAGELGIPVIAISGSLGDGVRKVNSIGIDAFFSALKAPVPEKELPAKGPAMLTDCAEQVARLIALPVKSRRVLPARKRR